MKILLRVILFILLGLILAEIEIRVIRPQPTFAQHSKRLLDIWPNMFVDDEILPYALRPGSGRVYDKRNGINVIVSVNSLGYRGEEFSEDNIANKDRILFIGDSVIFGYGIEDNQTLPVVLEKILQNRVSPKIQVINAGFKGYTSLSNYVYLRRFGLKLKPKLVLLGVLPDNDISDIALHRINERDETGKVLRVADKFRAIDGYRVSRHFNQWMLNLPVLRHSQFYFFLITRWVDPLLDKLSSPDESGRSWSRQIEEWSEYIHHTKELCESNSIPLVVVVIGCKDFLNGRRDREYRGMIEKLKELEIPFVNLTPYLAGLKTEDICFPHDGHLNSIGIDQSARYLAAYLIENNLLPRDFTPR